MLHAAAEGREIDTPEVDGPMQEFDADSPFAVPNCGDVHHAEFLFFIGTAILDEKGLALFDIRGERDQRSVRADRNHFREFVERFAEYVLPMNAHRNG